MTGPIDLRKLADAVCFDEPKLAPMFDWSQEPQIVVTDALREAADQIEWMCTENASQWDKFHAKVSEQEGELHRLEVRLGLAERVCESSWELQERDVMGVGRSPGVIMDEMQDQLLAWREAAKP